MKKKKCRIVVNVRRKHIDNTDWGTSEGCMIAQAIKEKTGQEDVEVNYGQILKPNDVDNPTARLGKCLFTLPKRIAKLMNRFDDGDGEDRRKIKPFKVILRNPKPAPSLSLL